MRMVKSVDKMLNIYLKGIEPQHVFTFMLCKST